MTGEERRGRLRRWLGWGGVVEGARPGGRVFPLGVWLRQDGVELGVGRLVQIPGRSD